MTEHPSAEQHAATLEHWARNDEGVRKLHLREAAAELRRLSSDNEALRARVQELGAAAKREHARVHQLEDAWNQALAAAPGPAMTREEISKAARQHPAEDICYWSHRMGVQDAERHHGVGAKGNTT